uniref:DinB-like domain-containing protein n=1 Tax=Craspedostauros australis TaxID=1486917 RepID=A0A7R9WTY2_9STRA|mmetsp:Transcript_19421/g.54017  ORF Transcript_19421/g.54017 Transcript_19421/m.54017 type:complete len:209 (+) Transcript_19421:159-785(+)
MTSPHACAASIEALCKLNRQLLKQKLGLMDVLRSRFGLAEAAALYKTQCPIVHASVGQHIRHSMDHIQLAVEAARDYGVDGVDPVHYDLRRRGGDDEHDIDAAEARIEGVLAAIDDVAARGSADPTIPQETLLTPQSRLDVQFMLSSDPDEFGMTTSIGRELGFVAHHAIHHLALVRIISVNTLGLASEDLPAGFGRAPSTQEFDNRR